MKVHLLLAFYYFISIVAGSCTVIYNIDSSCSENCTISSGIDYCNTALQCSMDDEVECEIQINSFNGFLAGNTNLTISEPMKVISLRLGFYGAVNLQNGFLLHVLNNSLEKLVVHGGTIQNSSTTAIYFESNNVNSSFEISGVVFQDCDSNDDTPPALHIDSRGSIEAKQVMSERTSTTGDCGSHKFQVYNSTDFELDQSVETMLTQAKNGGGICIFGSDPQTKVAIKSPVFRSCLATQNGGGLYIQGPGHFNITNASFEESVHAIKNGSFIYAENVNSLLIANSSLDSASRSFNPENGQVYAVSNIPGSSFVMDNIFCSGSSDGSGGCVYLQSFETAVIENSSIDGIATFGIGGGVVFDGVRNIFLDNMIFTGCIASQGAALACIGGSEQAVVTNTDFENSQSSSLDFSHVDIYSDGSCLSPFWYSQTPCPFLFACNSCNGSVCGLDFYQQSYGGRENLCYCYCGDPNCETPEITTSESPSPSPSLESVSIQSTIRLSEETNSDDKTQRAWSIAVVSIILLFLVLIVSIAIFAYNLRKRFVKSYPTEYDLVETMSPDTPQRDLDDPLYQDFVDEDE